jgi:hypothetical protein
LLECMRKCLQRVLDTADIVRDGDVTSTTWKISFSTLRLTRLFKRVSATLHSRHTLQASGEQSEELLPLRTVQRPPRKASRATANWVPCFGNPSTSPSQRRAGKQWRESSGSERENQEARCNEDKFAPLENTAGMRTKTHIQGT